MKKDLLIALGRHKRVIIIFLLTIFIPSVLLSVFGILALRNEKFRLEKQFEEEQLNIAEQIKSQVSSNISDAENVLKSLIENPLLINRKYEEIEPLLDAQLAENQLLGQFFTVYNDTRPWFLHFRAYTDNPPFESTMGFNAAQQDKLKRAERYEFMQNNYPMAIPIYEELLAGVKDRNLQGQILNHIARNLVKSGKYQEAGEIYSSIIKDFQKSKTSTGIPLTITSRLQLVDCYLKSGEDENALKESLNATKEILLNWGDLTENQLKTYTSMAMEAFTNILDNKPDALPTKEKYVKEFEHLKADYQDKIEQWRIIIELKNECIPELQREFMQTNTYIQNIFQYSKTIGDENFLILASLIPDKNKTGAQGILGVKINSVFFENDLIMKIIEEVRLNENANLVITDLKGSVIFGEKTPPDEFSGITSFFNDNFPPWRIEITNIQFEKILLKDIYKSFYFWTILTIIIILIFGVFLVMRTILHEMDVLKLKSELVSSVSHEFKTPITSIKALTERLLDEKVKDPARMKEYYSVILGDADNLSRLVSNFLDSSKIEEGKKQYDFEDTDIIQWMDRILKNFKNKCPEEIEFISRFAADIPHIAIDKNAMEQAINNLLDNAIKFSSGKIVVEIIVEKDENNLFLKVNDNGIGIHKEDLDKIFDKFYRGKNASMHTSTGTGLGLTLVRQIIEAHSGEISVDSKVGGSGSTFLILPLRNSTETKYYE
jgi:signal transduction histidine kinase/tetratricopeptide (TPR) repeat protein